MKILNKNDKIKKNYFEDIYKSYVNDVYKVALYFLKEEKKAQKITAQVFMECYENLDKVDSNYIHAYLVYRAKALSIKKRFKENEKKEVRKDA